MPLYEYLIVTKAGPAKPTMIMLQDIVKAILTNHPSVRIREVQNLGDRIMGNVLKKEKKIHTIGRYLQIMMDAPPAAGLTARNLIAQNYKNEVFRHYMHKVDDIDYTLSVYFRAKRYISPFNDEKDYDYAKRVMEMKTKLDNSD